MSIEIKRSDKYAEFNVSAPSNRGYITIDTSSWIDKPWMFYELPALKFEIYTESDGEVIKYKNFVREIRTYNPVYSPLGVLNVTIDIRNVPEEFTLRVIPIFDNDSISARNMLIENGIEDGEVWGKDQDIPTQSFDLDIEFIECTGEYIPPIPPTHEETVTFTEPPYTFDDSDGSPIISLTIKGNGQQSGTPSPQNIVPFDGCGGWDSDANSYKIPLTCASQTTPLYLGEVSTTRRIKKLVLTGEESGYLQLSENNIFAIRGVLNQAPELLLVGGYCTHYKYNNVVSSLSQNMSNGDFVLNKIVDDYSFSIKDDSLLSAAELRQYIAQQYAAGTPVTVWYVLAEPTTAIVNEPLMKIGDYADELTTTTPIPTARGSNTLTVDATVQPSEVSITYTAEG